MFQLTFPVGLSIGSLGKSQGKFANVSNIHFDRITVAGGLYAARLKSWVGGQGLVENVTWVSVISCHADIRMSTNNLTVSFDLSLEQHMDMEQCRHMTPEKGQPSTEKHTTNPD